jgi:hypothetical protein
MEEGKRLPALIITGAAGTGKSTMCAALRGLPGFLFVDGDVIAAGAEAVAREQEDYEAFWNYTLDIAAEIVGNGLVPVIGCVCLPNQALVSPNVDFFSRLGFLALTRRPGTIEAGLLTRLGPAFDEEAFAIHETVNAELRAASVPSPHSLTILDITESPVSETVERVRPWLLAQLG